MTFNHNDMLPMDKLNTILEEGGTDTYLNQQPFAHGHYDNLFSDELLDKVIEEFDEGEKNWREFETKYEKKRQMNQDINLGPVTRALVHNLNSAPFLDFLSKLTGIDGLIADPYLEGGGLHRIPQGGKLGVHIDFNRHNKMNVYRRINALIYLNKDWKEEYGGHLELWEEKQGGKKSQILPIFNRLAIFTTTATSFHGHPHPLTCPEDRSRMSLALYYYTANEPGAQTKKMHSTVFLSEDGKRDEISKKPGLLGRAKRKIMGN